MENNTETSQSSINTGNTSQSQQSNIMSNIGGVINKIGIDQTMIFISLIMLFLSTMTTWFYETSTINKNVTVSTLFTGPTYLLGVLIFLCFICIVIISMMEYFDKRFNKIPFINTDMQSTSNILSIVLFVLILCIASINMNMPNIIPITNISNIQVVNNIGIGFYLAFLGSLIILLVNIKKTFKINI